MVNPIKPEEGIRLWLTHYVLLTLSRIFRVSDDPVFALYPILACLEKMSCILQQYFQWKTSSSSSSNNSILSSFIENLTYLLIFRAIIRQYYISVGAPERIGTWGLVFPYALTLFQSGWDLQGRLITPAMYALELTPPWFLQFVVPDMYNKILWWSQIFLGS